MQRKSKSDLDKEKLPRFAKSYLSEAFPNPRRLDCPRNSELVVLAEHPREANPFIPQHLTRCSPCFRRYMEIVLS